MDLLGWLWWMVKGLLGLVWFLLGGWVSTLLQIVALVLGVFVFKYGWRQGPIEAWRAGEGARRFVWGWMKGTGLGGLGWRTAAAGASASATRSAAPRVEIRTVRVKEMGDVNLSTLLSVSAMAGVALLTLLH